MLDLKDKEMFQDADYRNFRTVQNDIEHDAHLEPDPNCSLCKHLTDCVPEKPCKLCEEKYAVTCGKGTLYKNTCDMCTKEKKCYFHTDYYKNTSLADNYPPNFNPSDLD